MWLQVSALYSAEWWMSDSLEMFDLGLIYYPGICLEGLRKRKK
jgi:hypothetical protein